MSMNLVGGINPGEILKNGFSSYQNDRLERMRESLAAAAGTRDGDSAEREEASTLRKNFPSLLEEQQILEEYQHPKTPQQQKLREASDEFASFMFGMLLKAMRKTVPKTGLLDGGQAEEIFRDFLDSEYSKGAVKNGTFPVAQRLYEQMSRTVR